MIIKHSGTKRHSGRYPWGSGDNPQRSLDFNSYVNTLRKQGLSDVEIAAGLKINTTQLRSRLSVSKAEKHAADSALAFRLKEKGYSNVAIGKRMGINESSVRSLLKVSLEKEKDMLDNVTSVIKSSADEKKYIDVGLGAEAHLGISRTKMDTAIYKLKQEGYRVHYIKVEQLGTGKFTTMKILTPPGITPSEVHKHKDDITTINVASTNSGEILNLIGYEPKYINSSRVQIRYKEDGGSEKDGIIELRRNVPDLSLGGKRYAQVRIGVDGTSYMKGMAIYSDNIPDGYDIVYNSNKNKSDGPSKVYKEITKDPDRPFGSVVFKKEYTGEDGKPAISALNMVNEEGTWSTWKKTISSQVLAKQSPALAKRQLDLSYQKKLAEYEELQSLTNPIIKKKLLTEFADDCDASTVHLKAAALPRQTAAVIFPILSLKETEVYAPGYDNGERVVLIRHPHGGIFEIPELTVNNKNREAVSIFSGARDMVGIHPNVAQKLSGADFDGDTVLVIPNKNKDIKTAPSLKGLKNFDPKTAYPKYPGMKVLGEEAKQMEMGKITNLITDMTIKGATENEIVRAVKHSMVVIDAQKHELNYKQSEYDNNISALKLKYQGRTNAGASTIISRAKSKTYIPQRSDLVKIDPITGKKIYTPTNKYILDKVGNKKLKLEAVPLMSIKDDAYSLVSEPRGTRIENIYADYANKLKALANESRLQVVSTKNIPYSPSARVTYSSEVQSLKSKLTLALRNKPLERKAQLIANSIIKMKKNNDPDITKKDLKKIKGQALDTARTRMGARKQKVLLTDREWEAIQAGAITSSFLTSILSNADMDAIKIRALPKLSTKAPISSAKESRAKAMFKSDYTRYEIAKALGISLDDLDKIIG